MMKRIFAAIKVEPDANLLSVFREIKKSLGDEKITWVDERNIHLTLKFFGDTPETDIPSIVSIFDEIAARHQPFEIELENVGIFGSSYNPRVVWFGMKRCDAIERLANDVLSTLDKAGFPRDSQHFRPHLTIGRIKFIQNKKYFQQVISSFKNKFIQRIQAKEFELIESKLTPRGPTYTNIQSFRF
jgi:2'-5' RNA ligase